MNKWGNCDMCGGHLFRTVLLQRKMFLYVENKEYYLCRRCYSRFEKFLNSDFSEIE